MFVAGSIPEIQENAAAAMVLQCDPDGVLEEANEGTTWVDEKSWRSVSFDELTHFDTQVKRRNE